MQQQIEQESRHPGSAAVQHPRDQQTEVIGRVRRLEQCDLGRSWVGRAKKKLGGLVAYSVTWHRTAAK
jgi:hypothetical protein